MVVSLASHVYVTVASFGRPGKAAPHIAPAMSMSV